MPKYVYAARRLNTCFVTFFSKVYTAPKYHSVNFWAFLTNISTVSVATQSLLPQPLETFTHFECCWQVHINCRYQSLTNPITAVCCDRVPNDWQSWDQNLLLTPGRVVLGFSSFSSKILTLCKLCHHIRFQMWFNLIDPLGVNCVHHLQFLSCQHLKMCQKKNQFVCFSFLV